MSNHEAASFSGLDLSVAMTGALDRALAAHFAKPGRRQEDLTFAYWRPSRGATRFTALLAALALPAEGERILQGNVAFTRDYASRVLDERSEGAGVALLHSHLGPGWQDMSPDDVVAERDRLAGLVAGASDLPLVGLTWGTDGSWSARFWLRAGRRTYERRWASTVRSVGPNLRTTHHPELSPPPAHVASQVATLSVWGEATQYDLARAHVGVVGVGSVGSIVAEALSRTGVQRLTLIDADRIEPRNLDRTLGAYPEDADRNLPKVDVSSRLVSHSHTAAAFSASPVPFSVAAEGLAHALDCDVLVSCVDRPWPRHVLNAIGYGHLIPVVDGGILARVNEQGRLMHVDWRIHAIGPERACLYCLGALRRSDVGLDRDGLLDDPDYVKGLSHADRERYGRRNVFAFSLAVAAHQVLQLVGLVARNERIGGIGPQTYHAYPGEMLASPATVCSADCDSPSLLATACNPTA